jgi:hypothetical protein
MQHTKRMVLVDEKFLEHFYRKEDSSWKRPSDQKAKSLLNRELKTDLDDPSVPDDIKVKQHQQHLNRFLHTTKQLPVPEPSQDLIDLKTVDDLLDLEPIKKKVKKDDGASGLESVKKKIKKESKKASFPTRHSNRKSKKYFKWESFP